MLPLVLCGATVSIEILNYFAEQRGMCSRLTERLLRCAKVAPAHTPLQAADRAHGRREVYFLAEEGDSDCKVMRRRGGAAATTLALHVDGWDLFASRVQC